MTLAPKYLSRIVSRSRTALHAAALLACLLPASATLHAGEPETMDVEAARRAVLEERMVLVDIRTPPEWRETGIPDVAVPLDMRERDFVPELLSLRAAHPGRALGLICATGVRSAHVAGWLRRNGVGEVVDVPAGMLGRDGWLARALPVRPPGPAAGPRAVGEPEPPPGTCRGGSC